MVFSFWYSLPCVLFSLFFSACVCLWRSLCFVWKEKERAEDSNQVEAGKSSRKDHKKRKDEKKTNSPRQNGRRKERIFFSPTLLSYLVGCSQICFHLLPPNEKRRKKRKKGNSLSDQCVFEERGGEGRREERKFIPPFHFLAEWILWWRHWWRRRRRRKKKGTLKALLVRFLPKKRHCGLGMGSSLLQLAFLLNLYGTLELCTVQYA